MSRGKIVQKLSSLLLLSYAVPVLAQVQLQGLHNTQSSLLQESPLLQDIHQDKNNIVTFTDSQRADVTDNSNIVTLSEQAQVRRNDAILKADTIVYNRQTGNVTAQDNALLLRQGSYVTGPSLTYNVERDNGKMLKPVFRLNSGGSGDAEEAEIINDNQMRLNKARYSACQCEDQFWHIKSDEVNFYNDENEGIARNGTLYIKGVPVFWSPWFTFPLRNERKTGLLTPIYGYSTRSGYDVEVPYYINLAPNYDLTLTPRFLSKRGANLSAEFRYLQPSYSGQVNASYMVRDRELGSKRWIYSWMHSQSLGSLLGFALNLSVNWNKASDDDYLRDMSQSAFNTLNETTNTTLNQSVSLNFSGHNYWSGSLSIQRYQSLNDISTNTLYGQYEKKPELTINGARYDWGGFDVDTTNTLTHFTYPTYPNAYWWRLYSPTSFSMKGHRAPEGVRFISYSSISYPVVRPGWYITPKVGIHYSHYNTQWYQRYSPGFFSQSGKQIGSQSRVLPILSLDGGMMFERDASFFGSAATQTLEPRIYYLYIPYKDQSDIPVYDTGLMEFNFASAFAENRYAGWDRINNANQLTVGLTSRWLDANTGYERLAVQIAQRIYFSPQKVSLYNGENLRLKSKSELLGSVSANLTNTLNTEISVALNPYRRKVSQSYAALRWNPKRLTSINLAYRYHRDQVDSLPGEDYLSSLPARRTVTLAAQWPFSERLSAVGRVDYSIMEKRATQSVLGIEYAGKCCWKTRVVLQRYAVSKEKSNSGVFFQLELMGLGSVGTNPVEVMRKNIPGYQDTDVPPSVRSTFERYE